MIGITVFSDTIIIFSTLKHILKHVPHGQVKKKVSVTRDDADQWQFWINHSGESHDLMTLSVYKYVSRTHNTQII